MSVKLSSIRSRVRVRLRDMDSKGGTYNVVEVDQAIADAYLAMQAWLPGPLLYTASAFTISAGSNTFTLPPTVTQWTGNDGGAEYLNVLTIQLASKGTFLHPMTWDQLMAFRSGFVTLPTMTPSRFALHESKAQGVTGYTDSLADQAYACNLTVRLEADDLRDFVGSASDDLDDVKLQMGRYGAQAVALHAAADLLERMPPEELAKRKLSGKSVAAWRREAISMANKDAARRYDLEDQGKVQRWVS